MARFKITTGVPSWTGTVGEGSPTSFVDGEAELDVRDQRSASRLAYFLSQGAYGVEPLDNIEPADAIRSCTMDPHQEAVQLADEIEQLKRTSKLDDLRAEHAALRREVRGVVGGSGPEPVDLPEGSKVTPTGGQKGGRR